MNTDTNTNTNTDTNTKTNIKGPVSITIMKNENNKEICFFGDIHFIGNEKCNNSITICDLLTEKYNNEKDTYFIFEIDKNFNYKKDNYIVRLKNLFENKKRIIMCDKRQTYEHLFDIDDITDIDSNMLYLKKVWLNILKKYKRKLNKVDENLYDVLIEIRKLLEYENKEIFKLLQKNNRDKDKLQIRYSSIIFDVFLLLEIFNINRKNIVVYAGETHIFRMKKILKSLGFKIVKESKQNTFQCINNVFNNLKK